MYGERFRELRQKLWTGTILELARRLDSAYPATVYNIERQWRVPTLPTIAKHAKAIGCDPWELLVGVDTEYDLVRKLGKLDRLNAEREWRALLQHYRASTERSRGAKPSSEETPRSAPFRAGRRR